MTDRETEARLLSEMQRLEDRIERALDRLGNDSAFMFTSGAKVAPQDRSTKKRFTSHNVGGRVLWELATYEMKDRQLRERFFPPDACDGAQWNMLLFLLASLIEKRPASVTDACHASRVAGTTALRHLALLVDGGWVGRSQDPMDQRRNWVELTDRGYGAFADYFIAARDLRNQPLRFEPRD